MYATSYLVSHQCSVPFQILNKCIEQKREVMKTAKPYEYLFNNNDFADAQLNVFVSDSNGHADGIIETKMKMSPIKTYPVHTLILASHSEYFNSAIRRWSNLVDGARIIHVQLPEHISLVTFKLLLKSFYTEKFEMDEDNAASANCLVDIVLLSEMFQAKYTLTLAVDTLKRLNSWQLDLDHMVAFFALSSPLQKDDELKESLQYSLRNTYDGDYMLNNARFSNKLVHFWTYQWMQ